MSHYNVLAYDDLVGAWYVISNHSEDDTTGATYISLPIYSVQTRFLMIAKTDEDYLHLAEVQVMGY